MTDIKYIRLIKFYKTNSSETTNIHQNSIQREIYRSIYRNQNRLINDKKFIYFKTFLKTFSMRILRDCNIVLQQQKYNPPSLKLWENLVKSYIRGILLNNENYIKSLRERRKYMPIEFVRKFTKVLFHVQLNETKKKPTFFNCMMHLGMKVFREDQQIILQDRSITELPYLLLDAENQSNDLYGRPKIWTSTFTIQEEDALREHNGVPRAQIENQKGKEQILNANSSINDVITQVNDSGLAEQTTHQDNSTKLLPNGKEN